MRAMIIDPFVPLEELRRRVRLDHRIDVPGEGGDPAGVQAVITAGEGLSERDLDRMPELIGVITAGTGVDHLDVELLQRRGIAVANVPDYCTEEVSDHAVAQACAMLRSLPAFIADPAGAWKAPRGAGVRRFSSVSAGVLGTGRIGRAICRKLAALGMRVLVAPRPSSEHEVTPVDGAEVRTLDELLPVVDVLVVASPGGGGTSVLGDERLGRLRHDAFVVNVSRASLVDLEALQGRLRAGLLAGAYFDVWDPEPPADPAELARTPGLFLSPHSGWYSPESADALWTAVAERLDLLEAQRSERSGRSGA